jgi:hypothetical protein
VHDIMTWWWANEKKIVTTFYFTFYTLNIMNEQQQQHGRKFASNVWHLWLGLDKIKRMASKMFNLQYINVTSVTVLLKYIFTVQFTWPNNRFSSFPISWTFIMITTISLPLLLFQIVPYYSCMKLINDDHHWAHFCSVVKKRCERICVVNQGNKAIKLPIHLHLIASCVSWR